MKKIDPTKTLKGPELLVYRNARRIGLTPEQAWAFIMNRRKEHAAILKKGRA